MVEIQINKWNGKISLSCHHYLILILINQQATYQVSKSLPTSDAMLVSLLCGGFLLFLMESWLTHKHFFLVNMSEKGGIYLSEKVMQIAGYQCLLLLGKSFPSNDFFNSKSEVRRTFSLILHHDSPHVFLLKNLVFLLTKIIGKNIPHSV